MQRIAYIYGLVLFLAPFASGTTYIVNPMGTGDFPTIQAAIAAADSADVVELLSGVYSGEGNRNIDFLGKAITVKSQTGDPSSCIINCAYDGRGFYFSAHEDATSAIEGVTVLNGYQIISGGQGGAVFCESASPTFRNCVFTQNVAGEEGGALYLSNSRSSFHSCTITNNVCLGSRGGGIATFQSNCEFEQCVFTDHVVDCPGGAVYISLGSAEFSSCDFTGNSTNNRGGAVYSTGVDSILFVDCNFNDNSSGTSRGGGALRVGGGNPVSINGCTFIGNSSGNYGGGSILMASNTSLSLTDCIFEDNSSIGFGGSIYLLSGGDSFVTSSLKTGPI